MRTRTRLIAATAICGALILGTAATAQGHSALVTGVPECAADGTYSVTWTGTTSNVPEHEEGEVKVIAPANVWLHEWAEHHANHGLDPLAPNASFTWTQTGIPGDATSAAVTFQVDWHGHSSDPEGSVELPGDCTVPTPTPEPSVEPSPQPSPTESVTPTPTPSAPEVTPAPPVAPASPAVRPEDSEPLVATG